LAIRYGHERVSMNVWVILPASHRTFHSRGCFLELLPPRLCQPCRRLITLPQSSRAPGGNSPLHLGHGQDCPKPFAETSTIKAPTEVCPPAYHRLLRPARSGWRPNPLVIKGIAGVVCRSLRFGVTVTMADVPPKNITCVWSPVLCSTRTRPRKLPVESWWDLNWLIIELTNDAARSGRNNLSLYSAFRF